MKTTKCWVIFNMYLLKILRANTCGDLFTNDPVKAKAEYRMMVKEVHPDVCKDERADEAIKKLNLLYEKASEHFIRGTWDESNKITFITKNGRRLNVSYIHQSTFELGERYVCCTSVVFVIKPENRKYVQNAIRQIDSIRYADDIMKNEFEKYMPKIRTFKHLREMVIELKDDKLLLVLEKPKDVIPLDMIMEKHSDLIDAPHIAWIISRLCNIACFLSYNGITHNGMTLGNLFISPGMHSVCLFGGWWYAVQAGHKMIGAPKDVFKNMPPIVKTNKVGDHVTDFESIKAIGRQLSLGKRIPDDMHKWLEFGTPNKATELFDSWDKTLTKSFGKRSFVKLDIDPDDYYKE